MGALAGGKVVGSKRVIVGVSHCGMVLVHPGKSAWWIPYARG